MSPAHVVEPTYDAIKRQLMAGEWPAGARLESARIADLLGVSVTPVRDSLYRLAGERMVDFTHGEGFHAHRLNEIEYRDMLECNLVLLHAALGEPAAEAAAAVSPNKCYAARTGHLFLHIAARAANSEILASIAALNDRLHVTRLHDRTILADAGAELAALEAATASTAAQDELRGLLIAYHERRAEEASRYTRLLATTAT